MGGEEKEDGDVGQKDEWGQGHEGVMSHGLVHVVRRCGRAVVR